MFTWRSFHAGLQPPQTSRHRPAYYAWYELHPGNKWGRRASGFGSSRATLCLTGLRADQHVTLHFRNKVSTAHCFFSTDLWPWWGWDRPEVPGTDPRAQQWRDRSDLLGVQEAHVIDTDIHGYINKGAEQRLEDSTWTTSSLQPCVAQLDGQRGVRVLVLPCQAQAQRSTVFLVVVQLWTHPQRTLGHLRQE